MTVDEKCTCGFPCLPENHALTQNRKNPEMILPVVPCSLHANWRLMEEMDHIDRLPSSQQRQRRRTAAKRPYLKRGWEMDSSPRTSHVIHLWETPDSIQWRKVRENTLFLFNFTKSYTNSHCAGRRRGNRSNCRLPAVLGITALEIQDCSPLQAWQRALWGHDDTPPTSRLKLWYIYFFY